jgi:hypothetical protein
MGERANNRLRRAGRAALLLAAVLPLTASDTKPERGGYRLEGGERDGDADHRRGDWSRVWSRAPGGSALGPPHLFLS